MQQLNFVIGVKRQNGPLNIQWDILSVYHNYPVFAVNRVRKACCLLVINGVYVYIRIHEFLSSDTGPRLI